MHGYYSQSQQLLDRARTALAQPEGEGPSEQEIDAFICQWWEAFGKGFLPNSYDKAPVTAALARWGRLATSPAPEVGSTDDSWWHELINEIARVQHVALGEGQGPRFDLAEAVGRWCRPVTPPAPQAGEVDDLIRCLQIRAVSLGAEGANLGQRGDAFYFDRAATLLQQLSAPAQAGEVEA
jgi:hypothetical protein